METKNVELNLHRGDAELRLNGDAETVKSILEILVSQGLGALSEFFDTVEGHVDPSQNPQSGNQPTIPGSNSIPGTNISSAVYSFNYHINQLQLPINASQSSQLGFNLDGDIVDHIDNLFGGFFSVMQGTFDFQRPTDDALNDGRINYLLTLQTSDQLLLNDSNASIILYRGLGDISGGDGFNFSIDRNIAPVVIKGHLAARHFISDDPLVTLDPRSLDLMIGSPSGGQVLTIALRAIRIEFDVNSDSTVNGKLGGAITQNDVSNIFIPDLANALTTIINNNQNNMAQEIKQTFDIGGNGSQAGDLRIDAQELSSNSAMSILAPDLSLFDSAGNYSPNSGEIPNAFSFGCGFGASHANPFS